MRRNRDSMAGKGHVSAADVDAQQVAEIDAGRFVDALADALENAIRVGVPVTLRPDLQAFELAAGMSLVADVGARQLRQAQAAVKNALTAARSAEELAVDVRLDDPAGSQRYAEKARIYRRQAELNQATLDELVASMEAVPPSEAFDVLTHTWLPALATLRKCRGQVDHKVRTDVARILPQIRWEFRSGNWWAVCVLQVNAVDGRVADLGPIEFEIRGSGNNSRMLTLLIGEQPVYGAGVKRSYLAGQLTKLCNISEPAARYAASSPLPQVPALLLHDLAGLPLPSWVTGRWLDLRFRAHLIAIYSAVPFMSFKTGRWSAYSPLRQAITHMVCDENRAMGLDEILERLPFESRSPVTALVKPAKSSASRPWRLPFVLEVPSQHAKSSACLVAPIYCRCGLPARIVARIADVPGDLLCRCGRLPDAQEYDIDPDMLFPEEYLRVEVPLEWCLTALRDEAEEGGHDLSPTLARLLIRLQTFPEGATLTQVAQAAGNDLSYTGTRLRRLASYGLIRSAPQPGRTAALWHYTERGQVLAERYALELPKTVRQQKAERVAQNQANRMRAAELPDPNLVDGASDTS